MKRLIIFLALSVLAALAFGGSGSASSTSSHYTLNCQRAVVCSEVQDPEEVFGEDNYVGHDEPSVLFYSNQPGAGNEMTYHLTLPKDPSPTQAGATFNFQLHPAFWFGMAMCDTQSYPEQVSTCAPDSDTNIKNNPDPTSADYIGNHAGTAFMELQLYPPGFVKWPAGDSCDGTQWCAALNIDSLSEDPINGTTLNSTCVSQVGSIEYVNFAFLTRNGTSQAPASPVNATLATYTPDSSKDLFMNSGDRLIVTLHDSSHGLVTVIKDLTTHQTGSMTASAANGFGQVQYDPTGTSCTNIPYDFHPMYSTSSPNTRVIWAAHSYNIAFSDETGHFEACNGRHRITPGGDCPNGNTEYDGEPTDANDTYCFPASSSSLVQLPGCYEPNGDTGFDSVPYNPVWPDGNTTLHPTSIQFSSPLTSGLNYDQVAFEADLPRIEFNTCNRNSGAGCTLIPTTDDGQPANFYPFYSIGTVGGQCTWLEGSDIPGVTTNDFGGNAEYGSLLQSTYLAFGGGGSTLQRYNNFRQILSNPCPS